VSTSSWYVLMARYSWEKRLRQALINAGCDDVWYPKQRVRVRTKVLDLPLDRYVFVRAPAPLHPVLWHAAGDCDGFVAWLGGEVPTALPDGELEVWRGGFADGDMLDEEATARLRLGWGVGDHVIATSGVLNGRIGLVISYDHKKTLAGIRLSTFNGRESVLYFLANVLERVMVVDGGGSTRVSRTASIGGSKQNNRRGDLQGSKRKRKFLRSGKF
jgi:hypothetical protein